MNMHLIYIICERSSVWTKNNAHMGYNFIVLGEIIDENTFDVRNASGKIIWFNTHDMNLDKPTKKEFDNFFNYIHTKEKEFTANLYELIEQDYPNILYKFPTLKQIRGSKIKCLL